MNRGLVLKLVVGSALGAAAGFLLGFVFPIVFTEDNLGPLNSVVTVPIGLLFGAVAGFWFWDTGSPTLLWGLLAVPLVGWMFYVFGYGAIAQLFYLSIIATLCGSVMDRFGFDGRGFGGAMVVGLVGAAAGAQLAMWFGLPMFLGTMVAGVRFDVVWSLAGMLGLGAVLR
jgi:hypothetical protein